MLRPAKTALTWLIVASAACGSKSSEPPKPAPVRVPITIDGAPAGAIEVPREGRRPLAELLPDTAPKPEQWHTLLLRSGAREVAAEDLPGDYPDHAVLVEAGPAGAATVGVFRAPSPGAPAHVQRELETPRLSLDRVDAIEIDTTAPTPAPAIELVVIARDGTEHRLALADFPRDARVQPTSSDPGARREARGWKLVDVVTRLTGEAPGDRVTLVLSSGERVEIPVGDAVIRTNARGYLVVTRTDVDAGVMKWRGVDRVLL